MSLVHPLLYLKGCSPLNFTPSELHGRIAVI
nr:MAG TPA: hypothetical protein [Caudoviricetes sp.]